MTVTPIAVDLYEGDAVQDFAAAKAAGIQLVILRATFGQSVKDKAYLSRRDAARKAGLMTAAYHFSTSAPLQNQLNNFLGVVLPDDDPDLRLILDWEEYDGSWMSVSDAKSFLQACDDATGKTSKVYADWSFLNEQLGTAPDRWLGSHGLWMAAYRDTQEPPTPQASWVAPQLWQYTGDLVGGFPRGIAGIPGNYQGAVDLNCAPGLTPDQFRARWLGDTSAPEAPHDWMWVQSKLKAAGLYQSTIDGDAGPLTEAAVAAFIEAHST